jgi:hypothetical protein
MSQVNLNNQFKDELKIVKSLKLDGVIEDYKHNDACSVLWVKAEGEWIEVWSIDAYIDSFNQPYNGV